MKSVFVLRSAPYKYQVDGKNLYRSFDAVIRGEVEIPVIKGAKKVFFESATEDLLEAKKVYSSNRLACRQTAGFISNKYVQLQELNEVGYEMGNFITESEFFNKAENANVDRARGLFVKAFVEDRLKEKRDDVFDRMDRLKDFIKSNKSGNIVFISHGFFIKIFEAYIKDKNLRKNPANLLKYFDGKTETYKFCKGIMLKVERGNIIFDSYI